MEWVDANYDTDHDGPSEEYEAGLEHCVNVGYYVKNDKDREGRPVIVLAGSAWVDNNKVHSRYHMTIARNHVVRMTALVAEPIAEA